MHPSPVTARAMLWIMVVVVSCGQFSSAQPVPTDAPFRFEMVLRNTTASALATGRSISFEARFYNDTDKPVRIPWGFTFYDDLFELAMVGPDGTLLAGPSERVAP